MKNARTLVVLVALAVTPLGFSVATAQTSTAAATAQMPMTQGEIRKVDKSAGKLTIKHGEIRNLDMPPMTMVFLVKDETMLDQVKKGDKVEFAAIDEGGKMVVTVMRPAQ